MVSGYQHTKFDRKTCPNLTGTKVAHRESRVGHFHAPPVLVGLRFLRVSVGARLTPDNPSSLGAVVYFRTRDLPKPTDRSRRWDLGCWDLGCWDLGCWGLGCWGLGCWGLGCCDQGFCRQRMLQVAS